MKAIRQFPRTYLFLVMASVALGLKPMCELDNLRSDDHGGIEVGHMVGLVVGAMILVLIVAALWGDFTTALGDYATNETTFGPVIQTIVPILVGAGILLLFVAVFLKEVN